MRFGENEPVKLCSTIFIVLYFFTIIKDKQLSKYALIFIPPYRLNSSKIVF